MILQLVANVTIIKSIIKRNALIYVEFCKIIGGEMYWQGMQGII